MNSVKITEEDIKSCNDNIFGTWIFNPSTTQQEYTKAEPFPHVIISNFLNDEVAKQIANEFPQVDEKWHSYMNPLEVKYAFDKIDLLKPSIRNIFYALSTPKTIDLIEKITKLEHLEMDPYLHGAGLHVHPRNGRLNIHLDYEKHIISGKERRLNIILYLSENWNKDWNGATELWNDTVSKCIVKSDVIFNTAILFQTNDISYHGVPEKISCPNGILRKSLAYYYVSDMIKGKINPRLKATYVNKVNNSTDERMDKLLSIRTNRRITSNDMNEIWPEWNSEDF